MSKPIVFRDIGAEVFVNITSASGDNKEHKATWMKNIDRDIFEMSFQTTSWIVHIKDGTITPLSCALYFTQDEVNILSAYEQLRIKRTDSYEKIYQRRAEEFYANQRD